ncbi:RagB/SusD family nutrient uptake outer membrane protein [Tunicatimonas pelagia]|uniref:RagB/SusD family nutrient uptake outer membrane protein n=1 Tax=Tunicatimonas pelagia TaxID=931531 RepID=UPI002665EEAC|nr:RagB/SusD family nutrient uptake outer membrane protein [Tunicatimonas pelagia]WKN44191.1 RagB/SusD family nutrient uptake outer membrane protein [Tunicatimonas pelagia]
MKNIKYIFVLVLATLCFSCDLEKNPYDEIAVEELFEDPAAVETATLGNYALLKGSSGFDGWADDLHRISEYPGDNVALSGGTSDHLFFLYNYQSIANNSRVDRFWRNSYKAAVGCNTIIERITEGESPESDQLLGENYYLRGLIYFQMGNIFGRPYTQDPSSLSIPLKLTSDTEDRPNRSTVQEVYEQVIDDLKKAEALMTINKGASFASKEAAQALLSRVYLYQEDHANTIAYADQVLESGTYSLLPAATFSVINTLTPAENSEAIFSVTLNSNSDLLGGSDHWFTPGSMYATIQGVGWGEMHASRSYLELLEKNPTDARSSFIDPQYIIEEGERVPAVYWVNEETYTYEFRRTQEADGVITFDEEGTVYTVESEEVDGVTTYFFNGTNGRQDVVYGFDLEKRNGYPKFFITKASLQEEDRHLWSPNVSRLAEMYLNKAEAYAKQNDAQNALDNVNIIRERAGIPAYSVGNLPDGMDLLDVVLEERRLEFAYEGQRRFDVYRNGRTMDRRYPGTHLNGTNPFFEIPASSLRIVEFIPEQQIVLQPSLIQND